MIGINRLKISLDWEWLEGSYKVFKYTHSQGYLKKSNIYLEKDELGALATFYNYGKNFYALFSNKEVLDLPDFTKEEISFKELDPSIIVSLLMGAIPNGLYFTLAGELFKITRVTEEKIIALRYKILDAVIEVSLTSFTKSVVKQEPLYYLKNANRLEKVTTFNKKITYYLKSGKIENKEKLPFLSNEGPSKASAISDFVKYFNDYYQNLAGLTFEQVNPTSTYPLPKVKDYQNQLQSIYQERPLYMINQIGSVKGKEKFLDIKRALADYLKLPVEEAYEPYEQGFNLIYLHNRDFYHKNKLPDTYKKMIYQAPIQCFTLENDDYYLKKSKELDRALTTILKELVIKYDLLVKKTISLNRPLGYAYTFVLEKNHAFYELELAKDGSFKINKVEEDIFNQEEIAFYQMYLANSNLQKLLIKDNAGNVNVIFSTNIVYLDYAQEGINFYDYDGNNYYTVTLGNNKITSNATHFYQIVLAKGTKNLIIELRDLVGTRVINEEQVMILPYPVKYLKEYLNLEEK